MNKGIASLTAAGALFFSALAALPVIAEAATTLLAPSSLKCEYSFNPLGIDTIAPRLFWRVEATERGERQAAFQILAASTPELLATDQGDLWDSGKVTSDASTWVAYAGKRLDSSQHVFWKVRDWDQVGQVSPWSTPAQWTMGLIGPASWKGQWIVAPWESETLLLRRSFPVRAGLKYAEVSVCGLGGYEMNLNGAKVSDDLLSPGWTDYDKTTIYDTYDVTPQLHEGANAVGLTLGNSMYRVTRRNRFVKFTGDFGPLRAIFHLRLEYADGKVEFVGSDENWRVHTGPVTYANIYGGEDFDARLIQTGWDRADFNESTWTPAVLLIRPGDTLRAHSVSAEPLRAIETHKPIAVKPLAKEGVVVFDLGQNASTMPRLRVKGPAGSTVRLTPGEIVDEDGAVNRSSMGGLGRGSAWWQYTKATDGEESWFPQFFYSGCRYLQAELLPASPDGERPHIESLEGVVVHSTAAPLGQFACSNPLLNRIRELVRWAQRSNMVSVLTDCPHREKLGWLEQYHLNGPSIRYEFDVARIFAKGIHDMADAQTEEGLIPNIAPEYAKFKGAFRGAAEWGTSFLQVPWQQYQFTGDIDMLRTYYPAMKRYFGYLETRARDDILSDGLGDWFDLGPKKAGTAQLTPPDVTASAFYYYDAYLLGKIAGLLGKTDEAKDYGARAERIRANYNRIYFHADSGSYATGSQCANAIPLVMNIVEPANRERVLAALVRDVEQHDYAVTAGDIGFRYLLQALAQGGRSDMIYRMINQDDKPGYGYQLKHGATSLTEAWDARRSASQDHFMLGQITEWFYKDLAGIDVDPTGAGFNKIVLRPNPVGDLTWAEASYDALPGKISMRWSREGERFQLKATVPANTTATVFVPAREGSVVSEGSKPAEKQSGVKFLRRDGDRMVYGLESGSYVFDSRW